MGKVGQDVLYVNKDGAVFAGKITAIYDENDSVAITFFPPGGGASGVLGVKHLNIAPKGDHHWKVK